MFQNKTIFIAPLDWGLGHATRCVPLIRQLMKNNRVILGVTPITKWILDEEFPELNQIELPSYKIKYSKKLPLWLKLGIDAPRISKAIREEHQLLNRLIPSHNIDVVISDNRFGLYSKKIHSVFITHQLFLKAPVFKGVAQRINKKYILRFNEVWIPDYKEEANCLSGELSHSKKHFHKNVRYIGPLSRLEDVKVKVEKNKYDQLILLSGPEPGRSLLEEALVKKYKGSAKNIALVRGSREKDALSIKKKNEFTVYDLPAKEELKKLILSADTIICRSGYSTLMDMHYLGKKKLILIPTPGQTEQVYLAEYWKKKFKSIVCHEKDLGKLA